MRPEAKYLFEISWEVCNKVGGINTTVRTKAPYMVELYGRHNYFLLGPYFHQKAVTEFQEKVPPELLLGVFKGLAEEGIICHYGHWLIEGKPDTILIDYTSYTHKTNEVKTKFWEWFGIDSLGTAFHDYDEPILWGAAAGRLLEELERSLEEKFVCHYHEWLSCGALLYLKGKGIRAPSVFTTHATVLGRTLAGNNVELYSILDKIDPDAEAYKWGVHTKHQTEKASAKVCDVFTTVSEITALEAERILGRKPEVILYNGIGAKNLLTIEELSIKHRNYRERIKEFLQYYFFPYYSFDLEETLVFFISGRYEFRNKGVDLFIEALARLNERLKAERSKRTIVAFFWIPGNAARVKPELLEARAYYEDIKTSVEENLQEIKARLIRCLVSRQSIDGQSLLREKLLTETEKKVLRFLKEGCPPLCTHDLIDEEKDLILQHFKRFGLLNRKEDKVKVVFYPIYLTGADNLLDLSYEEAVMGAHLGVFPSYYEPWGYTPLEASALGMAAVTTDYGGFGRFIAKKREEKKDEKEAGIFIVEMFNKSREEKIENLFRTLYKFSKLGKDERVHNRLEAQRWAALADWGLLIERYVEAHNLALRMSASSP